MKEKYPECLENIGLKIIDEFVSSNHHHNLQCLVCNNTFIATPKSKMQNFRKSGMKGCPKCTIDERFKTEKEQMRNKLIEMGFEFSDFRSKLDHITARNTKCGCGRSWITKPTYLLTGRSFCRPCNDDKKRKRFDNINKERSAFLCETDPNFLEYRKQVRHFTEKNYKKYKEIINPSSLTRTIPAEKDGHQLDHIVSVAYCWKMNIPAEICAHPTNLRMLETVENIKKKHNNSNLFPEVFQPYLSHRHVTFDFIREIQNYIPDVQTNVTYEGYNFEIFYNNTFISLWLFNDNKESISLNKTRILTIQNKLMEQNYNFVPVFEHEWLNNRKLVIAKILHLLGSNDKPKIYARKTIVKRISSLEYNEFMNMNHIQGSINASVRLGAFFNDKLVSAMSFSEPRLPMQGEMLVEQGTYELVRFASDINYNVIGTASKLLQYFKRHYKWTKIFSYADKRYSKSGNLYKQLGFFQMEDSKQNYYYSKDGVRFYHRYTFAKHKIKESFPQSFDESLTEYENMFKLGYDRIWDCGNFKFGMNNE